MFYQHTGTVVKAINYLTDVTIRALPASSATARVATDRIGARGTVLARAL